MEPLNEIFNNIEPNYDTIKLTKALICGICGENHFLKECHILQVTSHIPDKIIPSKARLTLPDSLEIRKLCDGTHNINTRVLIESGTQFGPFQAKKVFTLHPSVDFPLKIFTNNEEDLSEYFLDTSDENECSWMMFISPASDIEEQNIICYQDGEDLYYSTLKDIYPGEPLKVWYSPYYALKMKKTVLKTTTKQENEANRKAADLEVLLKKKKNIMPRDSWSCKFCGKVEKTLSVFALHLLEHYKVQARRICLICKDSFVNQLLFKKHLKIVHGSKLQQEQTVQPKQYEISVTKMKENEPKDTPVGGPLLLNNITTDSLDNSSLLLPQTDLTRLDLSSMENQNLMTETENLNVDNIINENVKQLDHFNFELNESESEQLICDICLKSFVKLKWLIQHLEQHTGKFYCYECNAVFARKENLTHHSCNLYYRIKCPLCEKIFFQQKYLTHHIKGFHNKKFTCEKCNRFYEAKQGIETHVCPNVPVHKREKFPCKICSKVFFHKKNLYEHTLRHEMKKTDKKFMCIVCNATLSSKKSYSKHVKTHEGSSFSCDVCYKVFSRVDTLNLHKNLKHHIENQVITCEICTKTLKSPRLLKLHMETHNKDRPYKCEVCQATFKQGSNLSKHKKLHKPKADKPKSGHRKINLHSYTCPKCNKNMKLRSSLIRHMKKIHMECEISSDIKWTFGKVTEKKPPDGAMKVDDSVMDLKETIENMNFNTDDVNNCSENNFDIDKILNNADNIDNFLSDSSDRIVENLISIATKENQLSTVDNTEYTPKEVCLSMPDLTTDQEIKLGENAYILDDGTIVEPQASSSKVIVYILGQEKFT